MKFKIASMEIKEKTKSDNYNKKVCNENQKFQIGDICKIVRADNSFCFPEKKDEETTGFGLQIMIVGSYGQIFPNMNEYDLSSYEVYVPKHLNESVYFYKNGYYRCEIPNFGSGGGKEFRETGWAWVKNSQLDFVRKPNKEDLQALYNYGKTLRWNEYKKEDSAWIWDSWEQMASQYINLGEMK